MRNISIEVIPNPAQEAVQIKSESAISNITLLNSLGQRIQEISPQSRQATMRLDGLEKGFYFLKIEMNGDVVVRKVIKN